jgi:hypothetical protein
VRVRTQGGFDLGPYVFGPKGVWVWVLPCSYPKWVRVGQSPNPRGMRAGSMSGPKMG